MKQIVSPGTDLVVYGHRNLAEMYDNEEQTLKVT